MIREITIVAVLNGWLVRVGCQTVVFTSADELVGALRRYLENPVAIEEQFLKSAVNARWAVGATPPIMGGSNQATLGAQAQQQLAGGMRGDQQPRHDAGQGVR